MRRAIPTSPSTSAATLGRGDGGTCGGAVVYCSAPGERFNSSRVFAAPFLNIKSATDLHVLTVEKGPVWTLFFTARKERSWGFATPTGWIPWRDFDALFPERNAWTETTPTKRSGYPEPARTCKSPTPDTEETPT